LTPLGRSNLVLMVLRLQRQSYPRALRFRTPLQFMLS
jgi:hypothetical protein